jgi:coenzyme F420 hydrogenase subunit beta
MAKKTIEEVIKNNLCTGCGTCVGICPNDSLKMVIDKNKGLFLPKLDNEKCKKCGRCYEICPGHSVDFKELNLKIFGKEPDDLLIGNYIDCYVGHARDYQIRYNSASGGLTTALLIYALQEGIIDGALVTRMNRDEPLEPEPFIARTREEIIEASKSKYCPVPANIALKEILNSKENEKFAVVGLPCHIHGIRKSEQVNKRLGEKIVLHFGIMCSHNLTFLATNFLINNLFKKNRDDIKKISYRGDGWPGMLSIELKNENKLRYPFANFGLIHLLHFFAPKRCLRCCDQTNELADISFGDAWLPEFKNDEIGKSIAIVRTSKGNEFWKKEGLKQKIEFSQISRDRLILSQKNVIRFKKKTINAELSVFGSHKPMYNVDLIKPEFVDYLLVLVFHIHMYISSRRHLQGFIIPIISLERNLSRVLKRLPKSKYLLPVLH